jgi:transcriptional regulator with XRE-family HTH domain
MIRTMDKTLIDRMNLLLLRSGKTAQRVSIEATGAKDTVRKILDGTTKNPRIDTLYKIAKVLETTPQFLMGETDETGAPVAAKMDGAGPAAPPLPDRNAMPLDVPVMGTAAGSLARGAFQLEGGVVDYVRRRRR